MVLKQMEREKAARETVNATAPELAMAAVDGDYFTEDMPKLVVLEDVLMRAQEWPGWRTPCGRCGSWPFTRFPLWGQPRCSSS